MIHMMFTATKFSMHFLFQLFTAVHIIPYRLDLKLFLTFQHSTAYPLFFLVEDTSDDLFLQLMIGILLFSVRNLAHQILSKSGIFCDDKLNTRMSLIELFYFR
jgi:hypothetical protein